MIEASLGSVLSQHTRDFGLEVLVVDGDSSDGTQEAISHIAARDARVRLIHNPGHKTPRAFNLGLRVARGEYVAILGAHSVYASDYISVCLQHVQLHDVVGCSGALVTVPAGISVQARLVAWTLGSSFASSPRSMRTRAEGFADTIPFPVFRKQALLDMGGYDEMLDRNQDNDMNHRLRAHGYRLYLTARTHCLYRARPSIAALWKYAFRSGLWNAFSLRRSPASMSLRHLVPALFAAGLLVLMGASLICKFAHLPYASAATAALLGLLATHLVFGLAAGAGTAVQTGAVAPLLVPPIIFGFHVAYGLGTLFGFTRSHLPSSLAIELVGDPVRQHETGRSANE